MIKSRKTVDTIKRLNELYDKLVHDKWENRESREASNQEFEIMRRELRKELRGFAEKADQIEQKRVD
jgi:hypothetical protein